MYKRADKRKARLLFNFITGVVIGIVDLVLLIVLQDKNLIRFLMTVYLCGNEDVNEVNWRWLWVYNSFLKKLVANIWGNDPIKKLTFPRLFIDYNN